MDGIWTTSIKQQIDRVVKGTKGRGDSKFFSTTKKGEISDLKSDLNSNDKYRVTEAVKKVIASMTVGKDVSSLFTDVIKSITTDNLELKKLVYLYIINYARSSPDKAILVVNTFQRDCSNNSPLIRALALRTMLCIRVDRIIEYVSEPLLHALKDKDPYVRKTAAIGVAKLYDINSELCNEQNFIVLLRELLNDSNPMVVSNAVAALCDISNTSGTDVLQINSQLLTKLLSAMNECTEWGQIFILDSISTYMPKNQREAEDTIERIIPRLKHANSGVVMSSIRVIINYLQYVDNNNKVYDSIINDKLPPPLISLLSDNRSEIQYVALRNIRLLLHKYNNLLNNQIKYFYIKYNDPIYIKIEKLDILYVLSNTRNIDEILNELREYSNEIDVEFVRKSIQCIGKVAIKIEAATEKCIQLLLELIQNKIQYIVQECIVVIRDIFRCYPNRYESIIDILCNYLEQLDEPNAKASIIWIIGEYSEKIDNATELLNSFIGNWSDETYNVQYTLLNAIVKHFLKRPDESKELVSTILQLSTQNTDNPDLRDRAYIYWRLLSTDPEQAQYIILHNKQPINDDYFNIDSSTLEQLIKQLTTVASVYHKLPQYFVAPITKQPLTTLINNNNNNNNNNNSVDEEGDEYDDEDEYETDQEYETDDDNNSNISNEQKVSPAHQRNKTAEIDLLGLMGTDNNTATATATTTTTTTKTPSTSQQSSPNRTPTTPPQQQQQQAQSTTKSTTQHEPFTTVLPSDKGNGLQIRSRAARRNGQLSLDMYLDNNTQQSLNNWAIKFNENYVGVEPSHSLTPGTVNVGQSKPYPLLLSETKQPNNSNLGIVQIAIKTDIGVFYWNQPFITSLCFTEDGKLQDHEFLSLWKSLPDNNEINTNMDNNIYNDAQAVKGRLEQRNVFVVATRITNKQTNAQAVYASCKYRQNVILIEIKLSEGQTNLAVKSDATQYHNVIIHAIQQLLST